MPGIIDRLVDKGVEKLADLATSVIRRKGLKWWFGHFAVPILTFLCVELGSVAGGESLSLEESLTAVPILSSVQEKGKSDQLSGLALILQPSDLDCAIPWTRDNQTLVMTSLDRETLMRNRDRFHIDDDGLRLHLPFFGVAEPFLVVARAKNTTNVWLPGKRKYPISELHIPSKRSQEVSTWSFVACMFGLGLVLNAGGTRPRRLQKNTSEVAAEEDERNIIQGKARKQQRSRIGIGPTSEGYRPEIPGEGE